eukprot:GFKZ01014129.1.p1 GENE.GFKZ01014129.1~~GFKZ01014129.1.p1  ORF type:complete len:1178 (-),score=186.35 GFKZ01014129.1:466-3999(-)
MRLSRRVSHIPSLQTPTPPGPACAHCNRPLSIQPAYIRCAEPACKSLPLCADCFSVGAYDIHPHQHTHPYRVVERVADQIYAKDWAAHEEERLLHALCEHGPYHWKDIADYVRSKTPAKCERHYHHVYLDGPCAPLPSEITAASPDVIAEPPSPAAGCDGKKVPADGNKHAANNAHERTVKPGVKAGVLEGYMPLRGDFDVEWDDEAENLVADLSIGPNETEEELELKMRLLENYDQRLARRDAVKHILFDHNLLDFTSHKIGGSRTAKDEKELAARLKVFARLLHCDVYAAVQESVTNIYRMSREVHRLGQARDAGVHRLAEVDVYEVERKARAATLFAGKADEEKPSRKRRRSSGPTPSSAKRARKSEKARSNERIPAPLNPALVLDENTALMYSPTPDIDALSLGVTSSDVVNNPRVNHDDPDDGPDTPAQSKTALLRKAREQRRMMRSTYPQVEPADMKDMPGAADLTESELVMCCALKLPPAEFITLRDAMLSAFGENVGPSTSVASESAGRHITTMRATRSRTRIENNEQTDTSRIEVAVTNTGAVGRQLDSTTKKTQVCETIKPGQWRGKRVTRLTSANSQQAVEGTPAPSVLHHATVELDGVPSNAKGAPIPSKRASDGVSSATYIENDMRLDDESRKHDPNLTARDLKTCNSNPRDADVANSMDEGNVGKEETPDIVVESVGKRGARLSLSLSLPHTNMECAPGHSRRGVRINLKILSDSVAKEDAPSSVPIQSGDKMAGNDGAIQTPAPGIPELPEAATDSVIEKMLPVTPRKTSGTPRRRSKKGRAPGRLTIRKRSRTQGRKRGRKPGPKAGGKKAQGVTAVPSPVKVEVEDVEGNLPGGNGANIGPSQDCVKLEDNVGKVPGDSVVKEEKCEENLETGFTPGKLVVRPDRRDGGVWVGPGSGSGKGYERFANGAIQEEVLDEGNAASLDGKATEMFAKTISGEPVGNATCRGASEDEAPKERINDSFVYIAPKASQDAPMSSAIGDQSGQGSENGESDGNAVGEQIQTSPNQCSESGSPVESLSGDDDGDPTVDFSPADEGSDDEEIVDAAKPSPRLARRSGGRRSASYIPVRVSSRIRKRKRDEDKVDNTEGTQKLSQGPKEGDEDEEWTGPDMAIGSKATDKKPPATPVRKSARKKRPRGSEDSEKAGGSTPTGGRYSLRRRG